jgi:hypothetical protein
MTGNRRMRERKENLEEKTERPKRIKIRLKKDEEGCAYIPFCNYRPHHSIILTEHICIERKCEHLRRLYIRNSIQSYRGYQNP